MQILNYPKQASPRRRLSVKDFFSIGYEKISHPKAVVWLTFVLMLALGWNILNLRDLPVQGWAFKWDAVGGMISLLIVFVSGIVQLSSLRYMHGDRKYASYFFKIGLLTTFLLLMINADHLIVFWVFWCLSNFTLAMLIIHKADWFAAWNSGMLMLKSTSIGAISIATATVILFYATGTFSLSEIAEKQDQISYLMKAEVLFLLTLAALIQSGVWPFHKWLLSSLNSPTPVSGLMHAGLVNGGGFLLARFAFLFSGEGVVFNMLFILGLISVVLGTVWKLMQNNVKKMLACSTMAQMGFMLMQCGLGLFSAALAHLVWHALFKCYLFLNSGSAIAESPSQVHSKSPLKYGLASLVALPGVYGFATVLGVSFNNLSADSVLVFFSWLAALQMAYLSLTKRVSVITILGGMMSAFAFGVLYGWTVYSIKGFMTSINMDTVLPLNSIHVVGMAIIFIIFLSVNLNLFSILSSRKLYVKMLNLSQSHPKTVTSTRSTYNY